MRHDPYILIGGDLPKEKIPAFMKVLSGDALARIKMHGSFEKWVEKNLDEGKRFLNHNGNTLCVRYYNMSEKVRQFCRDNDLPYLIPKQNIWWMPPQRGEQISTEEVYSCTVEDFIELAEKYDSMDKAPQGINAEGEMERSLAARILSTNKADKFENLKFLLNTCINAAPKTLPDFKIV